MIEDILEQAKSSLLSGIAEKYSLSQSQAESSVEVAKESVFDGMKNEFTAGNISGLLELFQGKTDLLANPIVVGIIKQYGAKLISQLGLTPQIANGISNYAIPFILNQFVEKTSDKEMDEKGLATMMGSAIGNDLMDDFKDKLPGDLGKTLGGLFG